MRPNSVFLIASLVFAGAGCWQNVGQGQEVPAATEKVEGSEVPVVSERKLETFYLERADGSLKPFFNIPFEEWDQLYKLYKGLQTPDQPPRFLLRDLRITGEIEGDFAFCTVVAKAISQSEGWVRIPLRFNQAVIVPDEDNPANNSLLEFDRDGGGLVWRVQGKVGQRHSLTVRIATRLRRLGDESVLELSLPNATTSRFQLVVPESGLAFDAGENGFLLNKPSVETDKTRIILDGIGGPLRLAWRKKDNRPNSQAIIKSVAAVRINFESQNGEQDFRADAVLQLTLPAGQVDSFIVRYPPGMQHLSREQSGLDAKVLALSDPRLSGARQDCEYVEFRLTQAVAGPIDIRLFALRRLTGSGGNRVVEVGGFEVLDAVSQTGTISLAASSDWSFEWSHNSAVEQLEEISDALRRQGVVASFSFSSQPCSLNVKVSRKEHQVHVEPRYQLSVEQDRVLLDATLSYRLRGAATQEIAIDFSGWQVDGVAIGADELLQTPSPDTSQPLRFSLAKLSQAPIRDFEVTVSAVLYFPSSHPFIIPLPLPIATSHAPAEVAVRHVEQIEVTPLLEKTQGLTEVAQSPDAAAGTGDSIMYRGWGRPERLVYAVDVQLRPPQVLATTEGHVTLAGNQVHVRQQIEYRVLYQSLPRLQFTLPEKLSADKSIEILLDQQTARWTQMQDEATDGRSIIAVELPVPRTGTFNISLAFSQAVTYDRSGESSLLQVPLAVPAFEAGGQVSDTRITVDGYDGRDVETDESWTVIANTTTADGASTQLRAFPAGPVEVLRLRLSGMSVLSLRECVVEAAWLQTWLTESRRSDRLAVKLATTREQVRFRLPPSAELEDVAVDQHQVTGQVTQEAGDVIVRLSPAQTTTRVVELWYSVPEISPGPGQYVVDVPQLIDVDWTRRFYWQLVLPHNEHFLFGASGLTAESSWNWRTLPFGRRPRFTQRDLERMVGTSEQLPLPETANQYLFSCQDAVGRVQFATANRGQILLVTGLLTFGVGLLFIYFAPLRHPAALLGLCVVLVSIGVLFPQPAIQVAQLSTLGILFVLVSFALKRVLTRTRTGPAIVHGSSLSSIDASLSDSMLGRADGSSQTSTKALVISHASDSASN